MIDSEFASYSAALFDFNSGVEIGRDSITLRLYPDNGNEVFERLMTYWGGRVVSRNNMSTLDIKIWELSGWDVVYEFLYDIGAYVIDGWRTYDILINYKKWVSTYGFDLGAMHACNWQIAANRPHSTLEVVTFDIETMGLKADEYSFLSCSFQKGNDEQNIHQIDIQSSGSEEQALIDTREYLEAAPWTLGFNSLRFDVPYINTRLAKYDERPLFLGCHVDASVLYDQWKQRPKRTSLVKAVDEQGLADNNAHKTPIDWDKWRAAYNGDKAGMAYVLEHAKFDVILTKRLYDVTP